MAASASKIVEYILLGPADDRRQLQDSPILADVWIAFAEQPDKPMDLLISPHWECSAGKVASVLAQRLALLGRKPQRDPDHTACIAYLQGVVAARLYFDDLLRVVIPMTDWWRRRSVLDRLKDYDRNTLIANIKLIVEWTRLQDIPLSRVRTTKERSLRFAEFSSVDRYIALAAMIHWAGSSDEIAKLGLEGIADRIDRIEDLVENIGAFNEKLKADKPLEKCMVWQVYLNRPAGPALTQSVAAVKADAARTLFSVKCNQIYWAIIDSGIDGKHPVFNTFTDLSRSEGNPPDEITSRIQRSLDFSNIRQIVSLDNISDKTRLDQAKNLADIRKRQGCKPPLTVRRANNVLKLLADDVDNERPIHWELVEELITIPSAFAPSSSHGTHVAGILGGSRAAALAGASGDWEQLKNMNLADGMCPDIRLYDLRVLGKTADDTEFAVIAALQYLRHLNERHAFTSIHGVNLSLSIPHDVRNFACGRTPVCNECERLVESGIVVVAAAGNRGYQSYETKEGAFEGYTAFSITDPGNADGVITVGATHRSWPHTYGVSFFSSRGPTGDGRLKPDLVAPGERIELALMHKDGGWGELDGTSMSAPHVSGAAAMLMSRYPELVGQPRRIKQIICEGATDLGRERTFQGNGMLDVLRAFQRI